MERSVKQKGTACLRCAICEAEGLHRKVCEARETGKRIPFYQKK